MSAGPVLLALDTAGRRPGVAVLHASGIVSRYLEGDVRRSEGVSELAVQVLQASGLSLHDVSAMAAVTGPGSYTGLRTGLAFVRGLAFLDHTPVVGVGSLELLAFRASAPDRTIVAVGDSGSGRFLAAVYRHDSDEIAEQLAPVLVDASELGALLRERGGAGEVTVAAEAHLRQQLQPVVSDADAAWIDERGVEEMAVLAAARVARGGAVPASQVLPSYIGTSTPRPNLQRVAPSFLHDVASRGDSN